MIPNFRYWIAKNNIDAVSLLFDDKNKATMFSLTVQEAMNQFPEDTLDLAIYHLSVKTLFGQSDS